MKKTDPDDHRQSIRAALRELGETETEIDSLAALLLQARDETALEVDPASTKQLIEYLAPLLPEPARQRGNQVANAAHRLSAGEQLLYFVQVSRAQVSILQPDFWLFSACITLLGSLLTLPGLPLSEVTILWLVAPILAVLGVHYGFRNTAYRVGELEATCPISPLRLTLARLMIVLSYDILLLGSLSLFLMRISGNTSFSGLALHWLTPLVLVTGLALVISLRFAMRSALTIGYAIWMGFVSMAHSSMVLPATQGIEVAFLLLGLGLLTAGVFGQKRLALQG